MPAAAWVLGITYPQSIKRLDDALYHIDSGVDDGAGANTIRFFLNQNVKKRYVRPFLAF